MPLRQTPVGAKCPLGLFEIDFFEGKQKPLFSIERFMRFEDEESRSEEEKSAAYLCVICNFSNTAYIDCGPQDTDACNCPVDMTVAQYMELERQYIRSLIDSQSAVGPRQYRPSKSGFQKFVEERYLRKRHLGIPLDSSD